MKCLLALEWSTRRISAALSQNGMPYAETMREIDRFHAPTALAMVQRLMRDAECSLDQVETILVGRGPGNYSGVRQAFAWAAGAAAPGGIILQSVSSARALGERCFRDAGGEPLAVLGDARRGYWWGSKFQAGVEPAWLLQRPGVWQDSLRGLRVLSSEPARLSGLMAVEEAFPTAMDLVVSSTREPLEPLYLHPPV